MEGTVLQGGEYCKEGIYELRALQGGVLGRVEGIAGWSVLQGRGNRRVEDITGWMYCRV